MIRKVALVSETKQKIIEAAILLFASKGYRETTIGQIEQAVGLAPRAGGFYRHFKAKEDLLVEALQRYVDEVTRELQFSNVMPLGDTRAELLWIGRTTLMSAERHHDLRTIVRREGRHIKELSKIVHGVARQDAYTQILPWLESKVAETGFVTDDIKALAINVFGPVFFVLYAQDQGDAPLGVAREDFLMSWATLWASVLDGPHL